MMHRLCFVGLETQHEKHEIAALVFVGQVLLRRLLEMPVYLQLIFDLQMMQLACCTVRVLLLEALREYVR